LAICVYVCAGYEEAAAQGLIAGINAARVAQEQSTITLSRDSSYIGTLLDDLVTKDLREPYRMLTSRCADAARRHTWLPSFKGLRV
jgi:tRNA U34 5-carboxymethylaminomethyl modifying enzyme MnmG/GidA